MGGCCSVDSGSIVVSNEGFGRPACSRLTFNLTLQASDCQSTSIASDCNFGVSTVTVSPGISSVSAMRHSRCTRVVNPIPTVSAVSAVSTIARLCNSNPIFYGDPNGPSMASPRAISTFTTYFGSVTAIASLLPIASITSSHKKVIGTSHFAVKHEATVFAWGRITTPTVTQTSNVRRTICAFIAIWPLKVVHLTHF